MIGDAITGLWDKIKQMVKDIPGKIGSFALSLVTGGSRHFGGIQISGRRPLPAIPGPGIFEELGPGGGGGGIDDVDDVDDDTGGGGGGGGGGDTFGAEPEEFTRAQQIERIERGTRTTAAERVRGLKIAAERYGKNQARYRIQAAASGGGDRYFYDHFGRAGSGSGSGRTNISNKTIQVVVNSNQSVSEILEDLDRMTTMDDASFFNSVM